MTPTNLDDLEREIRTELKDAKHEIKEPIKLDIKYLKGYRDALKWVLSKIEELE